MKISTEYNNRLFSFRELNAGMVFIHNEKIFVKIEEKTIYINNNIVKLHGSINPTNRIMVNALCFNTNTFTTFSDDEVVIFKPKAELILENIVECDQ